MLLLQARSPSAGPKDSSGTEVYLDVVKGLEAERHAAARKAAAAQAAKAQASARKAAVNAQKAAALAESAATELLREEEQAAAAAQRSKQRGAAKKARQKQRKQVRLGLELVGIGSRIVYLYQLHCHLTLCICSP